DDAVGGAVASSAVVGIGVLDGLRGGELCGGDVGPDTGCAGAGRFGSGVGAGVGRAGCGTGVAVGTRAITTAGRRVGAGGDGAVAVGVLVGGWSVGITAAGTGMRSGTSVSAISRSAAMAAAGFSAG